MTREHKLALIVGFALFLVVGVLVSDLAAYPELTDCVRVSVGTRAQNERVVKGMLW